MSGEWEIWDIKMMGCTDSPYHVCQAATWFKSIDFGGRRNLKNTFAWQKVVINFPMTIDYYCQRTCVYKQGRDGFLDEDVFF